VLKDWALDNSLIHLNHAAVGPWPIQTQQAICEFAKENMQQGSLNYLSWLKVENNLRDNLAKMINAPNRNSIALAKSTSEALSIIAYGIEFNAGDNILISDEEFPSNRIVWESLASKDVNTIRVGLNSASTPEQALMNACTSQTRLLSISSVQFATGTKIDLKVLGEYCKKNHILFCVDAIQSVGAEAIDVQSCHIDFLAADGHKWMLAPEGLAVFYCKEELLDSLKLHQFGWHMVEKMGEYDTLEWQAADSARRFECGSPNMLGIHALNASTSLLLEIGLTNVSQLIESKINKLYKELKAISHIEIVTADDPKRRLGILSFKSSLFSSEDIFNHLTDNKVFCAMRSGCVRLSPHYYTPDEQLMAVINLINEME